MFFDVDDLRRIINEMEIDGEKQDNDETTTDYTSYTQDDETQNNDENSEETSNDTEEDNAESDDNNDTEPEDYTQMNDDTEENQDDENSEEPSTEDDSNSDNDSSDDTTDYTQMNDDESSSDSENNETDSSEDESDGESNDNDSNSTEDNSDDNNEDNSFENLKKIEAELFSNLSDEQIAIKNTELKNQYIDLYTTIGRTLVRINDVAKTDNNIEILKFVTDKLLELRDMIDFNITVAFNTRTYIENNIIYQQCLSTLNAISDILANTPSPEKQNIEDDEYENSIEDKDDSTKMENEKQLNVSDTSKMEESAYYFNDYL